MAVVFVLPNELRISRLIFVLYYIYFIVLDPSSKQFLPIQFYTCYRAVEVRSCSMFFFVLFCFITVERDLSTPHDATSLSHNGGQEYCCKSAGRISN